MDGENNGSKPYENGWFGGFPTPIFGSTPISHKFPPLNRCKSTSARSPGALWRRTQPFRQRRSTKRRCKASARWDSQSCGEMEANAALKINPQIMANIYYINQSTSNMMSSNKDISHQAFTKGCFSPGRPLLRSKRPKALEPRIALGRWGISQDGNGHLFVKHPN